MGRQGEVSSSCSLEAFPWKKVDPSWSSPILPFVIAKEISRPKCVKQMLHLTIHFKANTRGATTSDKDPILPAPKDPVDLFPNPPSLPTPAPELPGIASCFSCSCALPQHSWLLLGLLWTLPEYNQVMDSFVSGF